MALAIPNELEKLRDGAKRFVEDFTAGQKAVVAIAFLAVVVAAVTFIHYEGKPSFAPLYTGLSPTDAGSITSKLASEKIPYQLTDGGSTVEVPVSDVYQQRITLAEAGLPNQQNNVGLSKVDKEGITTSSFQQQVDYQQGLQGELQTTIEAISGVASAQVNLVLPSDNPLALNNSPSPSAAVMITMANTQSLSSEQVQAIVHLVASSTPGLAGTDVTVTDSAGHLLAGPGANQQGFDQQNQQTTLYENGVAQKVEALLAPVVGPNNVVVTVNASLNFNQDSKTIHGLQTNPDGSIQSAPNQSNQQNETFNGTGTPPGGTAGQILSSGTTGGNNTLNQNGVQQNFTIGNFVEQVQTAPGAINTQNVAVVVNSRALPKSVPINNLYQLVSTAAAINNARGDIATVEPLPFSQAVQQAQANAQNQANAQQRHNEIIDAARAVGLALVILIILWLIHRSARKPEEIGPEELPALEAGEPEYLEPEEELMMGEEQMMEGAENPFNIDLAEGIPHELETSSIGEFIENQPDEVARLLRAWMQETKAPSGPPARQTEGQPA